MHKYQCPLTLLLPTTALLLPLIFASKLPQLRVPPFTPRQLIYSVHGDYLPFLLAPWGWPLRLSTVVSRLLQCALVNLYLGGGRGWSYVQVYLLWIVIGLGRTLVGFLLTRSVGWAYPWLFNHYALYETLNGGFGPALVAYLALTLPSTSPSNGSSSASSLSAGWRWFRKSSSEDQGMLLVVGVCTLISWLDCAPWTYATTLIVVLVLATIRELHYRYLSHKQKYRSHVSPLDLKPSHDSDPRNRLRTVLKTTTFSLILLPQPYLILSILHPQPISLFPLALPLPPRPPRPLLQVLILSHPRPGDLNFLDGTQYGTTPVPGSILFATINSYLPYLFPAPPSPSPQHPTPSPSVRLSIFTHTLPHPSFTHAQSWFRTQPAGADVEFYVDQDTHPDSANGQHLHLAEALRWVNGNSTQGNKDKWKEDGVAEWILLVEDDFALCGSWGWEAIVRVMTELEVGRVDSGEGEEGSLEWLGGFVGTGGSGLIIHHSLLPTLSSLLRASASLHHPQSPQGQNQSQPRPADLIIQDCLLGLDPFCLPSSPRPSFLLPSDPHRNPERGPGPLLITSKLVMSHTGSNASTTKGKVYQSGQWACGWRHPFHGREEVGVIVV